MYARVLGSASFFGPGVGERMGTVQLTTFARGRRGAHDNARLTDPRALSQMRVPPIHAQAHTHTHPPTPKHAHTHTKPTHPRSFVEVRETSLVWNFKHADVEFGRLQAKDLLQARRSLYLFIYLSVCVCGVCVCVSECIKAAAGQGPAAGAALCVCVSALYKPSQPPQGKILPGRPIRWRQEGYDQSQDGNAAWRGIRR